MSFPNNYKDFNEQDFINDPAFQDWMLHPDENKNAVWQQFITAYPEKRGPIQKAKALLQAIAFKEVWPSDEKVEQSLQDTLAKLKTSAGKVLQFDKPAYTKPLYQRWWAAAAIFLIIASASYLLLTKNAETKISTTTAQQQNKITDLAPGGNKAILTLADGRKIILDSAGNGTITKEGNTTVIKSDGLLTYEASTGNGQEAAYNTITTPNGGQYRLVLSDGSRIWLNAASSISYPTAFLQNERKVTVTGEAYFEVAHDPSKSFTVSVNGVDVEVLGTHFNVNAYTDESLLKTTLLQGKVKVTKAHKSVVLQPGQQAASYNDGAKENTILINKNIDVDAVVAWKNGLFNFEHSDIDKILREFARWYDVEVQYEGKKTTKEFFGIVSRNSSLVSVLKALKAGGPAHLNYSIVGKKLIVQSVNKN